MALYFDVNHLQCFILHLQHQISNYVAVNSATAHSHWETDGTAYNLGNSFVNGAMYHVIKTPPPLQQGEDFKFP